MAAKVAGEPKLYKRRCVDCRTQRAIPRSRRCALCRQARLDEHADRTFHGTCYRVVYPSATQEMGEANYDRMMERQIKSKNIGATQQANKRTETMPDELIDTVSAKVQVDEILAALEPHEALVLMMLGSGYRCSEIAAHLGVSASTAWRYMRQAQTAALRRFPESMTRF